MFVQYEGMGVSTISESIFFLGTYRTLMGGLPVFHAADRIRGMSVVATKCSFVLSSSSVLCCRAFESFF